MDNNIITTLKVDKDIKKVYRYVKDLLDDKGLYDPSLDFSIFTVSGLIFQFTQLVNAMARASRDEDKAGRDVYNANFISLSSEIRKSLTALGLNVDSKVKGVNDKDPMSVLMDKMNAV